ncbi:DUF4157 domain-containing protein [Streptomyces sp. 4.24]|uniref:eCIS core domain-containing protein n=1 Tax=Streptomyces tritrimontium TaxID=3406573 RepID=UPI003BB6E094
MGCCGCSGCSATAGRGPRSSGPPCTTWSAPAARRWSRRCARHGTPAGPRFRGRTGPPTDGAAHESAKGVNAHAYTVGSHVVFQRDAYDPGSHQGRTTLAHELTHVVQQRSGPVDGTKTSGGIKVSDPSDRFEREAVANADRVMAAPVPTASPVPTPTPAPAPVQREAGEGGLGEVAPVQGMFVQRAAAEEAEEDEAPAE